MTANPVKQSMPGVGKTSLMVAACRAEEARKPANERLVSDPFAEALASELGANALSKLYGEDSLRIGVKFTNILALRTRFIDDVVITSIDALSPSVSKLQIVILGSGMDTRALRLDLDRPRFSSVKVYELDFESVIAHKEAVLAKIGADQHPYNARRVSIAVDFSKDKEWSAKLVDAGFDVATPSIWILEGLTMYLTKPVVESILSTKIFVCQQKSYCGPFPYQRSPRIRPSQAN